jgi:D-alanyl-D-alanine carboxypeptidase (penicillin-binding protein 5/6)
MLKEFFSHQEAELRFFVFLCAGLSLLVMTSYVLGSRVERGSNSMPSELVKEKFPEVVLQAKAAYVYDARTKEVLFAKNENTRLPLASLTKVMSALVATELSPEYGTVTVSREALAAEGDSGLLAGERWSLKNLLDFSLVTSSNDGIRAVALALGALDRSAATEDEVLNDFVGAMNEKASQLNLKNTYYWNETGLDETEQKGGAYGTAKDMTTLMEYIVAYHPGLLEATQESSLTLSSLDEFSHVAKNTNALAGRIPGLIASKTGFTNTAGGNLVLVFDPELGRPIFISILGSTEDGRFADAAKLINAVMKYINQN